MRTLTLQSLSLAGPKKGRGPIAPQGFIFLVDEDGAYLTDETGAYLVEAI